MKRRALFLAVLAGCGFTAPDDPRTRRTVERVSVGASILRAPPDLSLFDAAFLQPDDASPNGLLRIPAEHLDRSTWGAKLDAPLPLQFVLPDYPVPLTRVQDFPQLDLHTSFVVLEHAGLQLAPTGSIFSVDITVDHPILGPEGFFLYSVGAWCSQPLPAATGALSVATTLPHAMMSSISGRPLPAITQDDAVMVLRYAAGALTGLLTAAPFDETGADEVSGPVTTLTDDLHLDLAVDRDVAATRLQGASPAVTTVGMQFSITAAPGAMYGSFAGPALRNATAVPPGTTHLDTPYNNPFATRGWPAVLFWQAYGTRAVTTRLLPVTLSAGMYEYRLAGEPGVSLLPAGLPQGLTFNGTPLSSDNVMLPVPAKPVEIEFLNDRPESSTVFQVVLYQLVPNDAGTALTYQYVIAFSGTKAHFLMPAELFVPGSLYTLRALTSSGGYEPGALEAGDLTRRALPFAAGYLDSGVFEVR